MTQLLEKILARVKAIKIGHPLDADTNDGGPINNQANIKRSCPTSTSAKAKAPAPLGGGRPKGDLYKGGYWVEPTVFGDVNMSMRIAKEEIFGPVMSISEVQDRG